MDTKDTKQGVSKKTLFSGRLSRVDFILFFLIFVAEAALVLAVILGAMSLFVSSFNSFIVEILSPKQHGLWLLLIPIILSPFIVMLMSFISRRLHDIGLSGYISLGFLVFFIDPKNGYLSYWGILALQIMMVIIFLMLVGMKGSRRENQYGSAPLKSSLFLERVFNL